ncbi:MAG: T9SS type A sorting domain-containing protein [Calditrichaeota bacterium]|nr:T9SS type A sorting domain-containing protein [Calditrichota bacterium]
MPKRNDLLVMLALMLLALAQAALGQFQWPDNGVSVRQGAHLGYSGAAVAAGNDVALFYYDCLRDGTRDVWGTRIAPDGEHLWGENGRLVSGNTSEQRAPVVATYPDGSVLVVWEDYAPGRFRDLMAQRYDQNGNTMWSPASGVAVVETYRDQFDVRLALNDQGYAFIAFTDDRLTTGADTQLNAYAQILSPVGTRVGPLDGIRLIDRVENYNVALDVACVGSDAYILCDVSNLTKELVIQKLTQAGTIGFPDDPALVEAADFGRNNLIAYNGGLALSWSSRDGADFYGDARLTLLNTDLTPQPGWTLEGLLVDSGTYTQTIVKLGSSPDGGLIAAVADFQFDPDEANLTLKKYSPTGNVLWSGVEFGDAALRTSPLDWYWDNNDLIMVWVETANFVEQLARSQRLSSDGTKQWGSSGRLLWTRDGKKVRIEIEKPATGPARAVIVSGRFIAQPESLFVAELSENGELAEEPEFLSGGWTYDSNDPRVAQMGDQKAAMIWTDSRTRFERDVYYQLLDGSGVPLLEAQGRKLNASDDFSVYAPPAVEGDGQGGAFLCWVGDSIAYTTVLHVHRINGSGSETWSEPARIRSQNGFYGQVRLVPDGSGGVFVAFSRFDDLFLARVGVAHINSAGQLDWDGDYHEFPGQPGNDMILNAAVADGQGGCFLAALTGPWTDTDPIVFHVNQDGSFGAGWSNDGLQFGGVGERDRSPSLLSMGQNVLLTYERPQYPDAATYDIRGILLSPEGETVWGGQGRRLTPADAAPVRHILRSDGEGGFLIGYEDFRGTHTRLYVARFTSDGLAAWVGTERLACNHELDQTRMIMTHDGRGGAWIMWEDFRNSDEYPEIDLYGTHIDAEGEFANINGFTWPADGYPVCALPTYQQEAVIVPWSDGAALAVWKDLRSSNPGRCCGAGAVGDIFNNVYAQALSETALGADEDRSGILYPSSFILSAYPNPFNPSTTLSFSLPQNAGVTLTIYNVLGQVAETLLDAPLVAGSYSFTWDASAYPSGLYFAKLETTTGLSTIQKLTLLK